MASPTLLTPTSKPRTQTLIRSKFTANITKTIIITTTTTTTNAKPTLISQTSRRREFVTLITGILAPALLFPVSSVWAAEEEEEKEYTKETVEVINKVRSTINMDKNDPSVADSVSQLRETSNSWVAKYRREKSLLGRASFRDMYSALNAISGHYISFGPTAPIPAKRKARILEEMDTAEKALLRGR